jgi:hypothetical protein
MNDPAESANAPTHMAANKYFEYFFIFLSFIGLFFSLFYRSASVLTLFSHRADHFIFCVANIGAKIVKLPNCRVSLFHFNIQI